MTLPLKRRLVLGAVCALVTLSACQFDGETELAAPDRKIVVTETARQMQIPADQMTADAAADIAAHYRNKGDGPMDVSVLYDPAARGGTAVKAAGERDRIVNLMKKNHINDLHADTIPVNGLGDRMQALVTYNQLEASAPEECPQMMDQTILTDTYTARDYPLGCTMDDMVARQAARPGDLLGRDDSASGGDGRRGVVVTEPYRVGVPNQPLQGESASGD